MKFAQRLLPAAILAALPLVSGLSLASDSQSSNSNKSVSVLAEQSSPERLAKYRELAKKKMHCDAIDEDSTLEQKYQTLSGAKWDIAKMGCGVQYGNQLADSSLLSLFDIELQLTVLGKHAEYFETLHKEYPSLYSSPEVTTELDLRWEQNKAQGQIILDRLEPFVSWMTEFKLVKHAFLLASTQHLSSHKATLVISQAAIKDLEVIVQEEPETLDALGPLMLGQLLLALPEFSGGDPVRAIELLEQGTQLSPNNLSMHKWLIDAYVAERESDKALQTLEKAALIAADQQHPQDHSDSLKDFVGFAISMRQLELAKYFKFQRSLILKANPQVDPRVEVASMGHGGENPITGKDDDEI